MANDMRSKNPSISTKYISLSQASLLLVSIFAFAFILSLTIPVSAQLEPEVELARNNEFSADNAGLTESPSLTNSPSTISDSQANMYFGESETGTYNPYGDMYPTTPEPSLVDTTSVDRGYHDTVGTGLTNDPSSAIADTTPDVPNDWYVPDNPSSSVSGGGTGDASSLTNTNTGSGVSNAGSGTSNGAPKSSTTAPAAAGAAGAPMGASFMGMTGAGAHLMSGVVWGGMIAGAVSLIGNIAGLDKGLTSSLTMSSFAGIMAWQGTHAISAAMSPTGVSTAGMAAPLIGIGVAAAVFILTYKKETMKIVTFQCLPWEAPIGGQNCEDCNKDPLKPCSEYRCKSLGQACNIVNKGTKQEMCIWVNKGDTKPPVITPDPSKFSPTGLRFTPDNSINPPNTGVKIVKMDNAGGCLKPYTQLKYGFTTDEPAQCRLDLNALTAKFDTMEFLFGDNSFSYNHTIQLKIPAPSSSLDTETADAPEVGQDQIYTHYTRCRDGNGNENTAAFAYRFCVDPAPDTTEPIVEGSSIPSGSSVQAGAESVPVEIYTNELSECRWSVQDQSFETMENTMDCPTETYQFNADMNYVCSTSVSGIRDLEDNHFFFRCRDYPPTTDNMDNVMKTSFDLLLKGSQALVITSVGPNGTLKDSISSPLVNFVAKTAFGADSGSATCYLSETPEDSDSFYPMDVTGTTEHSQNLTVSPGEHQFTFNCKDSANNIAQANTTISVLVDSVPPIITRMYRDGDHLTIVTNEPAKCSYSQTDCLFDIREAVPFVYEDSTKRLTHSATWSPLLTYYVKCEDLYGNRLDNPAYCNVIIKGADL